MQRARPVSVHVHVYVHVYVDVHVHVGVFHGKGYKAVPTAELLGRT